MSDQRQGARRRLQIRSARVQAQPTQLTPSDVFLATALPTATMATLGRMRGSWGQSTAVAYGNSTVTSDARASAQAQQPGKGGQESYTSGSNIGDASPYPGPIRPTILTAPSQLLRRAYTPAFQNGAAIAHDRHIIEKQGTVDFSSQQQQTGGSPNPEKDGPARPVWQMWNRTVSFQMGTDSTRMLDGGQYHARTMAGSRPYPLGTQGDRWSRIYGGTPWLALYRPYGTRGASYPGAPQPEVRATPGGPYRFGTLLQQGDPGDGPQMVYPGLPWGLHSSTVPPRQVTGATAASRFWQVKPVWAVRPQNSRVAGQSYNQQVVSLTGHQSVRVGSMNGGRQPGLNASWLGTG